MSWFDENGGVDWADPGGGVGSAIQPYTGGDMDPAGAGSNPFGYTKGTLLTPWEGSFSSAGYGGGMAVPEFRAHNFEDFSYRPPNVGQSTEQYTDPAAFRFADYVGPDKFAAPTREDMEADPGYQFRKEEGERARSASAANRGALRTGGFMKGMEDYAQGLASQEYGNVYNRRGSEWDREANRMKENYLINQGKTKEAFDTNVANKGAAFDRRLGQWKSNADVGLQSGRLGFDVAQGAWDRNYAKSRTGWQDQANADAAAAAASNAGANQNYERSLADYMRNRDEFWTNQDRQYALLDNEDRKLMGQTNTYANLLMGGYGGMGDAAIGAGDSRAAGHMASGNMWGGMANDVGNMLGGMAMDRYSQGGGSGGGYRSPQIQTIARAPGALTSNNPMLNQPLQMPRQPTSINSGIPPIGYAHG
jgi:hypothetical protein